MDDKAGPLDRSRVRSWPLPSGCVAPHEIAQELLAIAGRLRMRDDPALDAEARRIEVIVMGGDPGMVVTLAERVRDVG